MTRQITAYDIPPNVLDSDYRGCGKAWAAIADGRVVALRYMALTSEQLTVSFHALPAWTRAVEANCEGRDAHNLPNAWSSKGLANLAAAASACEDCPAPPNGGRYRPKELLTMARAVRAVAEKSTFQAWRERARDELGAMGEVVGGMCSCTQFVATN